MYASVADLRAEGVTAAEASDARLELLLAEASSLIDRVTGWFFEPRQLTQHLSGRGAPSIDLPVPPIRVDRLVLGSVELSLDPSELLMRAVRALIHEEMTLKEALRELSRDKGKKGSAAAAA